MGEKISPIILLSGPVGAGKTTVAQEMIKSSSHPTVYIEGDKFWFFIVKGDKSSTRKKNFTTIIASMTAAAAPYALNGYEVILDFSIPPWFLDTIRRIAGAMNIPLEYIVLRPAEKICAQRAAFRKDGVIADYAPYHDFYLSFDEASHHIISDDSNDINMLADKIKEGRKAGVLNLT